MRPVLHFSIPSPRDTPCFENWAQVALLLISAVMLLGFLRGAEPLFSPTTMFALLLTVGLPAVGGIALLRGSLGSGSGSRMAALRQQTIDAEILKLAMTHQGRLTEVEVASALALPAGEARASLDSLVARHAAELDVTDDGVLVYTFHDARYFDSGAKGLLDA